jgi:hypothetical protein
MRALQSGANAIHAGNHDCGTRLSGAVLRLAAVASSALRLERSGGAPAAHCSPPAALRPRRGRTSVRDARPHQQRPADATLGDLGKWRIDLPARRSIATGPASEWIAPGTLARLLRDPYVGRAHSIARGRERGRYVSADRRSAGNVAGALSPRRDRGGVHHRRSLDPFPRAPDGAGAGAVRERGVPGALWNPRSGPGAL